MVQGNKFNKKKLFTFLATGENMALPGIKQGKKLANIKTKKNIIAKKAYLC